MLTTPSETLQDQTPLTSSLESESPGQWLPSTTDSTETSELLMLTLFMSEFKH